MAAKNFNEELKNMEAEKRLAGEDGNGGAVRLDDTQRVKVLSPGQLVFKRFIRNKLAIVGTAILAFMFLFCFAGPFFYRYKQTEKFYKTDIQENTNYAFAKQITEYNSYALDKNLTVHYSVINNIDYFIKKIEAAGLSNWVVMDTSSGAKYIVKREAENVYTLNTCNISPVGTLAMAYDIGTYDTITETMKYSDGISMDSSFLSAVADAILGIKKSSQFKFGDATYLLESAGSKKYLVRCMSDPIMTYSSDVYEDSFKDAVITASKNIASGESSTLEFGGSVFFVSNNGNLTFNIEKASAEKPVYVSSLYVIDRVDGSAATSADFIKAALTGIFSGNSFVYDNVSYLIKNEDDTLVIYKHDSENPYAIFSTFSVNRSDGSSSLPFEFKKLLQSKIEEMDENSLLSATITAPIEKQASDGSVVTDENGNIVYEDTEITITRKGNDFAITCDRYLFLIDIYGAPRSKASEKFHILGTDGDGYDVLSRMMYGGRISLIVGFVVVIIETLLGIIMGGISGYFGGWVDTLIMRLVDIFYCIPTLPILIILGAFFDAQQMKPYVRLMWLMAVLGFLGWASVARLVRGQILSLREQDFMVATEVGGLRISRRIFRHLIPNVMPQLIVTATAGLGSVILTESTLSFLGLGVKHPLATWGSMINSVSDYSSMINYEYIWIPVGMLICITVIAFNFVGDGLRDAFDPKMKR